ncbi:MAG: family 43 glycosylhydrolase, partial [Prevotella sp.]
MKYQKTILSTLVLSVAALTATAQNPVIRDQFTADPTARVYNNKVYLYPSHDI